MYNGYTSILLEVRKFQHLKRSSKAALPLADWIFFLSQSMSHKATSVSGVCWVVTWRSVNKVVESYHLMMIFDPDVNPA